MVWGIDGGKYFIREKLVCKNVYLILYIGKYFSFIEVLKIGVRQQFFSNFVLQDMLKLCGFEDMK